MILQWDIGDDFFPSLRVLPPLPPPNPCSIMQAYLAFLIDPLLPFPENLVEYGKSDATLRKLDLERRMDLQMGNLVSGPFNQIFPLF